MYDVVKKLTRRDKRDRGHFDARPYLFPAAISEGYDPFWVHDRLAWVWGRGSSKTTTATYIHAEVATRFDRCCTIYFSDTIRRAIQTAWPDFEIVARLSGGVANRGDHTVYYPNGSRIIVTGMDHIREFDRNKGIKRIALVHGDECQDQQSDFMNAAATRIFGPRMGDLEGEYGWIARFLWTGTGGKDAGYWYEVCEKETNYHVTRLTQWENPHIANPDAVLRRVCADARPVIDVVDLGTPVDPRFRLGTARRVDCYDPEIRREFFCEFNGGGKLQIFTITPKSLCTRASLKLITEPRIVVGVDFGTVNAWAGVGWLFSDNNPVPKVARYKELAGLSNSKMVRATRKFTDELISEYRPVEAPDIEADGGGLGKGNVMDIQATESAWDVNSADKQTEKKAVYFRSLAGDLRDGHAQICEDLKGLIGAFKVPEWHPDHIGEKLRGHVPDVVDGASYGYRKVKRMHAYQPPAPPMNEIEKERARERELQKRARRNEQLEFEEEIADEETPDEIDLT